MIRWPKDTQAARNAFYGDPGKGEIARQMVPVVPPFAMYYDGKRVKAIQFHNKAAAALLAAFNEIWDYYEHDQKKIDAAGVSKYAGAYNPRMVRGSKTKWSNHAYAAAIDLNAEENGLYAKGNIPQPVIDAFCRQGWMWGGWYNGRKDPMHFEAVDNGGRKPTSAPPIWPRAAIGLIDNSAAEGEPPADVFEDEPAPEEKPTTVTAEVVQRRLEAMGYFPGVIGTPPGGITAGAIAGFKNDRHMTGEPVIDDALLAELSKAEGEGFKRPIAEARATATEATLSPKNEGVRANWFSRQGAKILAIPSAIGAAISGAADNFPTAKSYIEPVMNFFTDMPGWVWFFAAAAIGVGIWFSTRKAGTAMVQDYREARRL